MTGLGEFKRYKIGDAAKILGVKPYVLRFWEGEFADLEPVRTPSGQRLYTEEHMDLLRRIKGLLYDEGLTIDGARKRLGEPQAPAEFLQDIADELRHILDILAGDPATSPKESDA
jgi:DNA-binding transcriptional MerR regulator